MSNKDSVPSASLYQITPKEDCPHIDNNIDQTLGALSRTFQQYQVNKCSVCNDPNENWICLSCLKTFCSRFVKGHALEHYNSTRHCIVASFSDLSVWCYHCDSYVKDPKLNPSISVIHMAKFGEPIPSYEFVTQIAIQMNVTGSEQKEQTKEIKEEKEKKEEETKIPTDRDITNANKDDKRNIENNDNNQTLNPTVNNNNNNNNNKESVVSSTDQKNVEKDSKNEDDNDTISDDDLMAVLVQALKRLRPDEPESKKPKEKRSQRLPSLNIDGVVEYIKSGRCRNIIVMNGAGISVAAGIPDFRSPQTGLYHNLQKYDLPYPEAIFEINYFEQRPEAFYTLAKELYPGNYKPTPCHWFCHLLHLKGLLLRVYTQNIDTLERMTGLDGEKIVEAHGSFATSHCIKCHKEYPSDFVKGITIDVSLVCLPKDCNKYQSDLLQNVFLPVRFHVVTNVMDIVFFGESLPPRFFHLMREDFPKCDLLIVMGTSLKVQPFANLINNVPIDCPRVLINKEAVGLFNPLESLFGYEGFMFDHPRNYRDVAILGDCQESVKLLVEKLGWKEEFEKLIKTGQTK